MTAPAELARRPRSVADAELKQRVHARLLAEATTWEPRGEGALRDALSELLRAEAPLLPHARHASLLAELVDEVDGLGPLQPLCADPHVTEVMVNGPDHVYVERDGRVERVRISLDATTTLRIVQRIIGPLGLRLDRASPIVDARLPDGSRLHAVVPPLAIDGPCVTIRRFGADVVDAEAFAISPHAVAFLRWAVAHGANIVVSGGTSAGKTTLCNTLAGSIPRTERVVTIEETAELRLPLPHVVRLEARLPNAEGVGGVPVRALVRAALRMRPDRLIVGEVRGAEAFDLLQALNTGHDGSLTTLHANGIEAVVDRLVGLVLMAGHHMTADAIAAQIAHAIDYVVHVVRRHGRRYVRSVGELTGVGAALSVSPLFEWRDGALRSLGAPRRPTRRPDAPQPDPRWFRC